MPTVPQLKAELKQLGVKGYSGKLKGELMYMLVAAKKAKEEVKKPEPVKIAIKDIREKRLIKERELELQKPVPPPPTIPLKYKKEILKDLCGMDTSQYKVYGSGIMRPYLDRQIDNLKRPALYGDRNNNKIVGLYYEELEKWIKKVTKETPKEDIVLYRDWETIWD